MSSGYRAISSLLLSASRVRFLIVSAASLSVSDFSRGSLGLVDISVNRSIIRRCRALSSSSTEPSSTAERVVRALILSGSETVAF